MAGVHNSFTWTQSDDTEVISAKSRNIVRDTAPQDYVEKISRFLESSVTHSNQVSNEPAEAESDSGDSLFLTQKPVPEALRTQQRQRSHHSLKPVTPRSLEESKSDSSSTTLHEESKTYKKSRRKKYHLPEYSFPFLSDRKWKLSVKQNRSLHNATITGFFKCVREQWRGCQVGDHVQSSLPTVDMEGQCISPLSESDDEKSENYNIKVVARKHFASPSKAKSRRTWCSQRAQRGGKAPNTGPETPRTRQQKTKTETQKTKNQRKARRSFFNKKTREEELFDDSDVTDCELQLQQRTPSQCTIPPEPQTDVGHTGDLSQTWQTEEQPEGQSVPHSDNDDDRLCNETRLKSRKKKEKGRDQESVDEQSSQDQDEPEGLRASVSVYVGDAVRQSQENMAEPPALQARDELEFNEMDCMESAPHDDTTVREERETPDSKQKKKKRKKSAAGDARQEVDGDLDSDMKLADSMVSVSSGVENGNKEKKKKKRKKSGEDDEINEQLQPDAVTEPLNDDAEIPKKKKKKRKEKTVVTDECEEEEASNRTLNLTPVSAGELEESAHFVENAAAPQELLESSFVKRKKHKRKHQSSSNDAAQDGAQGEDVSLCNDAEGLQKVTVSLKKEKKKKKKREICELDTSHSPDNNEMVENVARIVNPTEGLDDQNAELVTKKKKKKKKKKDIPEGVDPAYTPGGNEMVEDVDDAEKTHRGPDDQSAELVVKKKKKKKKSKISSNNLSEESVAQSDDSVSVQEKEKRRTASFLTADAEENDAQTQQEQSRVKKKNRKRKMSALQDGVEGDHEQDFEEPKQTCLSASPETTNTGVKRKKRKENKGESETPVKRFDSRDDGGQAPTDEVQKKKKRKKKKSKDKAPAATEDAE